MAGETRGEERGPGNGSVVARLERLGASALFAYGSLLAIQAKVLWGIWEHRDLTSGDTTNYFVNAGRWSESLHLEPLWSPMYLFFWGSLRWLVSDPYAVTILHRVLIAVAASLLVLAVLRRLLTPGIAWVLAVWWAILPVNYDTLYEVHLFAVLPALVAVLIGARWSGPWGRAAVFGVLLATAALARNEAGIAVAVWLLVWLSYEIAERRRGKGSSTATLIKAVAVPALAVFVIASAVVVSADGLDSIRGSRKHTLNVCQIYAFGYQQRHDDFTASPWTDCQQLMERDFDQKEPSFTEAVRANPGAIGEHVLWNIRIAPYAIQLLMFDRMSADARHSPDYAEVTTGSVAARLGLVALATFIIGGLVLLWRDRRRWWDGWIRDRVWGWVCLGALGISAVAVIVWQRPRPSYLFALSVLILAVIGMCAMVYADRWPPLRRLRAGIPVVAVAAVIALPPHYGSDYKTQQIGRPDRPLKAMVDRLYPFRDRLQGADVTLLATYSSPGCPYIGDDERCTEAEWGPILDRPPGQSISGALEDAEIDYIYADSVDLSAWEYAVKDAVRSGWRRVAGEPGEDRWVLLERPEIDTDSGS